MAKIKGDAMVANLCKLLGWPNTGEYQARALAALNEAQQAIDQLGSLQHLDVDSNVTLPIGLDYVDVSALAIDPAKQVTLRQPGNDKGAVVFLDRDKMLTTPIETYGAWDAALPAYWTWGSSTTGALRIVFDRVNATGSGLTFGISYQRISPAILNSNASESTLIEGYELTLLQPYAELILKRPLGKAGWQDLHSMLFGNDEKNVGGRLGRFLDQFTARKEDARPDREQIERSQTRRLSEGT